MISLDQLQELRSLVHKTVTRIQALELENSQLRQKLGQIENDWNGLLREKQSLEQTQELVGVEVGELLNELQELQLDAPVAALRVDAEKREVALDFTPPEVESSDSTHFLEKGINVDPKQVCENDYEAVGQSQAQVQQVQQVHEIDEAQRPTVVPTNSASAATTHLVEEGIEGSVLPVGSQSEPVVPQEEDLTGASVLEEFGSHSLDLSLGLDGSSLLGLEDSLSSLGSAKAQQTAADDLDIF